MRRNSHSPQSAILDLRGATTYMDYVVATTGSSNMCEYGLLRKHVRGCNVSSIYSIMLRNHHGQFSLDINLLVYVSYVI